MTDMPSVVRPDLPEGVDVAIDALGNRVKAAAIRSLLVDGPATQTQLAARLSLTRTNMRRHLAELEDLGLLRVHPPREEPDTRRRQLSVDADRLRGLLEDLAQGLGLD